MLDTGALHLALRGVLLNVSGIPSASHRAWENKDFTPTDGQTYLEEELVPQSPALLSTVRNGIVEAPGLYVVKVYGIANSGITAIRTITDAVLAAFPAGTTIATLANGDKVRVGAKPAPWAGQILPDGAGRAVCTITIPYIALSTNT